jgi:hypothetical protein
LQKSAAGKERLKIGGHCRQVLQGRQFRHRD